MQEYLRRFHPDGFVTFAWSDSCSKPRLDEFGGGASFITADAVELMSVYQWQAEKGAEHTAKSEGR